MTLRALVVEDDLGNAELAIDKVHSLGHECDVAHDQESARAMMTTSRPDYVLLDLSIPVRKGRAPRPENGENLLREMKEHPKLKGIPVIITTAHGQIEPQVAVELMKIGATDFLNKPCDGRLDAKIRELVELIPLMQLESTPLGHTLFDGGELVVANSQVILCGVIVVRKRGLIQPFLEYIGRNEGSLPDAETIARELGVSSSRVFVAISRFRQACTQRLSVELNLSCGAQDVIANDGKNGYRLAGAVQLKLGGAALRSPVAVREDKAIERQKWIRRQLELGANLRVASVMGMFSCSARTARRDIEMLRDQGLSISFEGAAKTGHYCLLVPVEVAG